MKLRHAVQPSPFRSRLSHPDAPPIRRGKLPTARLGCVKQLVCEAIPKSLRSSCSASMRSRAKARSYSVAGGLLSKTHLRPTYADRFTTVLQEHIMSKYVPGWALGVPVLVPC